MISESCKFFQTWKKSKTSDHLFVYSCICRFAINWSFFFRFPHPLLKIPNGNPAKTLWTVRFFTKNTLGNLQKTLGKPWETLGKRGKSLLDTPYIFEIVNQILMIFAQMLEIVNLSDLVVSYFILTFLHPKDYPY